MASVATVVNKVCLVCKKTYPYLETHVCAGNQEGKPTPIPDDPLVGATLGDRYQITQFLSSGGMGVVYKARHVVLDKPLAIKLLRESQDPVAQQRFLLEAKSACHIGHEHILDINDFGVLEDGRPYLVMEFLQGQSLETVLTSKGALPWRRAARIAEQIARGLQAVHDKGILHRDLKPGNVFLLERQRRDFVKILDFGIAKVMAGTRESLSDSGQPLVANMRQTTQGTVLGTPEYLSPEQAAGEAIDNRVDIYALGCILYEMLTGFVPFRGNGPMSTLMKHLTETAAPIRQKRPDLPLPEAIEKIVKKAMAREKADRYPTMESLADALQNEVEAQPTLQGDLSISGVLAPPSADVAPERSGLAYAPTTEASIVARPTATVIPTPRNRILHVLIAVALGLLVVAGVVAASFFGKRHSSTQTPTQAQPEDLGTPASLPSVPPDLAPPLQKPVTAPDEKSGKQVSGKSSPTGPRGSKTNSTKPRSKKTKTKAKAF